MFETFLQLAQVNNKEQFQNNAICYIVFYIENVESVCTCILFKFAYLRKVLMMI